MKLVEYRVRKQIDAVLKKATDLKGIIEAFDVLWPGRGKYWYWIADSGLPFERQRYNNFRGVAVLISQEEYSITFEVLVRLNAPGHPLCTIFVGRDYRPLERVDGNP